eukprot:7026159-Karenia_brevis.AAC.1
MASGLRSPASGSLTALTASVYTLFFFANEAGFWINTGSIPNLKLTVGRFLFHRLMQLRRTLHR